VPAAATAVTGVLSVSNSTADGWLALASDSTFPTTFTLNFPKGDARATGVTVPLGTGGQIWVTYGAVGGSTADVAFDVTGYFLPGTSGSTYIAITPNRIVDSRTSVKLGLSSGLTAGSAKTFQVTGRTPSVGATNVPSSAIAVTGTLTVTGQTAAGSVALTPTAQNVPTTACLYFPSGDTRANGVTVMIGAGGTLSVTYTAAAGAKVDVIFDVTGYVRPGTSGATYMTVTQNRLVDSRTSAKIGLTTPLSANIAQTFQVTNRVPTNPLKNVPIGALAVTGTLTVTGQTAAGWLALTTTPQNNPSISTLNFPKGDIRSTGVTVLLSSTGQLSVTYGAAAGSLTWVIFDVTGYFLS
jgi:hypothetical protein